MPLGRRMRNEADTLWSYEVPKEKEGHMAACRESSFRREKAIPSLLSTSMVKKALRKDKAEAFNWIWPLGIPSPTFFTL